MLLSLSLFLAFDFPWLPWVNDDENDEITNVDSANVSPNATGRIPQLSITALLQRLSLSQSWIHCCKTSNAA